MANKIQVKRSAVAAKIPTTGDLDLGEIAINTFDGKMFIKKDNGTASIVEIGGGSGSGDVVGPASATDNAIARYDGTTGKLIQNSTVTINDDGTIGGANGIELDISPTNAPTATGSIAWDVGDGTPYVVLNADVSLQLGQENVAKVYNGSGATITKGKVVAVSGAQGQRPSVVLADADSEALSAPTLGITTENIANGAEGFVCTFGLLRGIDTSAFTAGQPIYLSSTAGDFTATKPVAPQHIVALGWVVKVNASSGEIFININNGWELDELHNVLITTPVTGNLLAYDGTASVWKNTNTIQAATTFQAGDAIRSEAAATQDAIVIAGRTGGTNSYAVTLTPDSLASNTTLTLPNITDTVTTNTATQTLTNKTIVNATITNYTETRFTANSGTAITLDLANGTMQDITLTGNVTITMPTVIAGKSFILMIRSGAGSYAVTWSTVKWPSGTAPTVTTTASRLDIYSFFCDGTNWYGLTVSQNYTP
jgi:hypothetical protein